MQGFNFFFSFSVLHSVVLGNRWEQYSASHILDKHPVSVQKLSDLHQCSSVKVNVTVLPFPTQRVSLPSYIYSEKSKVT